MGASLTQQRRVKEEEGKNSQISERDNGSGTQLALGTAEVKD